MLCKLGEVAVAVAPETSGDIEWRCLELADHVNELCLTGFVFPHRKAITSSRRIWLRFRFFNHVSSSLFRLCEPAERPNSPIRFCDSIPSLYNVVTEPAAF